MLALPETRIESQMRSHETAWKLCAIGRKSSFEERVQKMAIGVKKGVQHLS